MIRGTLIFGRRGKKYSIGTPVDLRGKLSDDPRRLAEYAFKQKLGYDVSMKQMKIHPELIRIAEKTIDAKFDKKPRLFTYEPKDNKGFMKMKRSMRKGWDGASLIPKRKIYKTGGPVYRGYRSMVIIPKSHLKDKDVTNMNVIRQLGYILADQEKLKLPTAHMKSVELERKYERSIGTTRTGMLNRSRSLFNNPRSWNKR